MNVIIDSKEFKFNISWRWNLQPCKVICKLQVIISKYSPLNCWIKFIWKPKAFWSHRGNETKLKIDRIKLIYLFTRPWSQCFLVYLLFVRLETKSELSRHLVASSSKEHQIPGLFGNCGTLSRFTRGLGRGDKRLWRCGHFYLGNFKISRFDEMKISSNVARANYDFLNMIFFIYWFPK